MQQQNANMRFQNLPNRSDFSPSGIESGGFSERESPQRFQQPPHQQIAVYGGAGGASNHMQQPVVSSNHTSGSHKKSNSRVTSHT